MRTRSVALAVSLLVASACSSGPSATDRLADNVAAQAEAQEALRQRLDDLEGELRTVTTGDPQTGLRDVAALVEDLTDTVAGLASDLEANAVADAARDDGIEQLGTAVDGMAETVAGLQATIATLTDEVARVGDAVAGHVDDAAAHVDAPVERTTPDAGP